MWKSITYVSSAITLAAFVAAVIANTWKLHLQKQERLIQLAAPKDRADLVAAALESFRVNVSGLTKQHQYEIALRQIDERARRFRIVAKMVASLAVLAALVGVFAIWIDNHSGTEAVARRSDQTNGDSQINAQKPPEQLRREMLYVANQEHQRLLAEYNAGYAIFGITNELLIVPYDTAMVTPKINWTGSNVRLEGDFLRINLSTIEVNCGTLLTKIRLPRAKSLTDAKMHFGVNNFLLYTEVPRIGAYGRVVVVGIKDIMDDLPLPMQRHIESLNAESCRKQRMVPR
jgi:hypothetical protein